jgi:hypothetical protein
MKIRKIKEYIIYNIKKEFHIPKKDIYIDILKDSYRKYIVGVGINRKRSTYCAFSNTLLPCSMQLSYRIDGENKKNEPNIKFSLKDISVAVVEDKNENKDIE